MDLATLLLACLATDPAPIAAPSVLAESPIGLAAMRSFDASAFAVPLTIEPVAEEGRRGDSDFSYTYIQAGYTTYDVDLVDEDLDSFHLRGSFEFLKFLHAFAGYSRGSTDFDDAAVDFLDLGIGGHFAILKNLDLVGELAWLWNNIDGDNISDESDTGYSLYAGARFMVLPFDRGGLEVNGGIRRVELEAFASERITVAIELGVRVHFLERFSIGLTYADVEDDASLGLDGRFSF